MTTAIDSSVLLLVLRKQPGWESWRAALTAAAREGPLVICPVVFAECSVGFSSAEQAMQEFELLRIIYDEMAFGSAYLAGQVFVEYRKRGGKREYMVPDFLIAAHASLQANRLAAVDRGYLRTYFPELKRLGA